MYIIVGGTGRVGSATAQALLKRGEAVTIVTRDGTHAQELRESGATFAVCDVRDVPTLRDVFRSGKRAFLLNPPASPTTDTDAEERANATAILGALEGSGLEKVVAASTYGARPGERCGDLTVLHEFEQRLKAQPIPAAINRGAYYMSNWIGMMDAVRKSGTLPSFFPVDMAIPMVAPEDLGEAAARRLLEPVHATELRHIEGPDHCTPRDVAGAFARAFDMNVDVAVVPREAWEETFLQFGFSLAAARSYACMTASVVDNGPETPADAERGLTTLAKYIRDAVAGAD